MLRLIEQYDFDFPKFDSFGKYKWDLLEACAEIGAVITWIKVGRLIVEDYVRERGLKADIWLGVYQNNPVGVLAMVKAGFSGDITGSEADVERGDRFRREAYFRALEELEASYAKAVGEIGSTGFENDGRYKKLIERVSSFNVEQYKKDFVLIIFPLLFDYENKTGIPLEIMFGQICIESSYGKDPIAINANNYFGYKGKGPAGSYASKTKEVINGQHVEIIDDFRKYNSMSESIDDYIDLLLRNYKQYSGGGSPKDWANALDKGGYATAPDYGSSVLNVASTWRIYE